MMNKVLKMKSSGFEWLGKIPQHWELKRLKFNYCKLIAGQSPPSASYSDDIGISFIQGSEEFGEIYPDPKIRTLEPTKIVKNGAVLISVRAPVGELNIADSDLCIGRGIVGIQCQDKKLDSKFLYYFLKGTISQLQSV